MNTNLKKFLAALAVIGAAHSATAAVLDITNPGGSGRPGPTFGDTATVNFSWDANMAYSPGYSQQDVFYCDPQNPGGACKFSLTPTLPATDVILNGFTLGVYQAQNNILWSVKDLSSNLVVATGTATANNLNPAIVDINLMSTGGFEVSFGPDSYLGGLINVTYNNPVPAPATIALIGSALFGFAAARRRA